MASAPIYQCALITGASSGIGAEFARQLAPVCRQLVMVARRIDQLESLAAELEATTPGVVVHSLQADLTDADELESFWRQIESMGLEPDLLVNNAGMGDYGEFASSDWPKVQTMIRLNMEVLTQLAHMALPAMIARCSGNIINVSSLASILPIPDFAVYAATKAYVTSFSEALRIELLDCGVKVLALCPGPVHTGFGQVAQRGELANVTPGGESVYVDCKQVVAEAIDAIQGAKPRCYPGKKIALMAALIGLMPGALIRKIMARRPRRNSSR